MFKTYTLSFLLLLSVSGISQMYSPDAHYGDTVQYAPYKDSVFVFNEPDYGDKTEITLTADSPDSTSGWAFSWYKYDTTTLDYSFVFAVTGISSKIDTITTFAGYRLIRSKGATIDTSQVWVIFHDFKAEITTKDNEGNIPVDYTTCKITTIRSKKPVGTYPYNIPGIDSVTSISTSYNITWEKDTEEGSMPTTSFENAIVAIPPYDNTTYIQTVTDSKFKLERTDTVHYIAVKSKSVIGNEHIALNNPNFYPKKFGDYYTEDYESKNISAPAKYKFYNNESRNATRFNLKFGDNTKDTTFYNLTDTIVHEFYYPGTYQTILYTFSPKPRECIDSSVAEITIAQPTFMGEDSIKFPNAFSPDGDELNDVFRTEDVSIFACTITIFNRYGQKVHEFSGNMRDWPGWDGSVMNSKRKANEGIYYYIVDYIVAFESVSNKIQMKKYKDTQKTGFVYLFRGK